MVKEKLSKTKLTHNDVRIDLDATAEAVSEAWRFIRNYYPEDFGHLEEGVFNFLFDKHKEALEQIEQLEEAESLDFEEGDKVKLRDDLELNKRYNGMTYLDTMAKLEGVILEVEAVCFDMCFIEESPLGFGISMFEKVDDEITESDMTEFEEGDLVKLRDDLEVGKSYGKDFGINYLDGMSKYENKLLKVEVAGIDYCHIEGIEYGFSPEMFEKITPEEVLEENKELRNKLKKVEEIING